MVGGEVAHGVPPGSAVDAVQREQVAHARDRELGLLEQAGARRRGGRCSAKWASERALCWPPTIVKCDWWPFSQARKTMPVL